MKYIAAGFFIMVLVSHVTANPPSRSASEPGLVVTTDWLSKHLKDDNLVLLHVHRTNGGYKREHIPGARFLWYNALAKDTPERSTELPSEKEAGASLRDLGINDGSRIVLYFEGQNITMTTRMIFTLSYLGLGDRVSLLDGGFETWKREGRAVTKEIPKVAQGAFVLHLHPELLADAGWIQGHLSDPKVTIIDARIRGYYDGTVGNPPGHIPHSLNIPYLIVADSTNRMLAPDSLRQIFVRAGAKPGSHLVTYCHVGQSATLVYFAARYVGYDVSVYDGSFEDWADRELPVEKPSEKK